MTEKEVIQKQEENGQQEFYLIQIGSFVHAYGQGAFALARTTGYKVKRKHRKMGEVLTAGFPVTRIEQVMEKIVAAGGEAAPLEDGKTWLFNGIDGTPDESMIAEPDWKALPPNHSLFYNGEVGLPVRNVVPEAVREAFPPSSSPCKGVAPGTVREAFPLSSSPCKGVAPGTVREAFPLSSSPCKGEVSEGCSTYSSSPCKGEVSEGRRGNDFHWLADALRNFNLSAATPLEAMMFIGDLQKNIKDYGPK